MRLTKKSMMIVSFCVGALMLVTTAFAEISSKSGYEQLKDAVKLTAKNCSTELKSYTFEGTIAFKDNGKLLFTSNAVQKYDTSKKMTESTTLEEYASGKKYKNYSYTDSKKSIWYGSENDTYYVNEFSGVRSNRLFSNPFEEERAKDVERIFDAAIGNLKDYVVATENTDGSKEYSGSLTEAQIPTLINAISSFAIKQETSNSYRNNDMKIPQITDDVFIKKVTGNAYVNKDEMIESVLGSIEIYGKDADGNIHNLTIELLVKISDIGSTVIEEPNLEGKKIQKGIEGTYEPNISAKFVGKYKNDIVIDKDNSFTKIGERYLIISDISDKNISARYYEVLIPEYSDYSSISDFTFNAKINEHNYVEFEYIDSEGNKGKGSLSFDTMVGKIYFNIYDRSSISMDSSFNRVFEE